MQEAVPLGEGSMTAVLKPGLDVERLRGSLAESDGIEVDLANDNSPDQIVLSGNVIEPRVLATQPRKEDPVFARGRCIPLRVSRRSIRASWSPRPSVSGRCSKNRRRPGGRSAPTQRRVQHHRHVPRA